AEAPGILNWAVQGCLAWQHEGLDPPTAVRDATAAYAQESDPLAEFISEACVISATASVRAHELFVHYREWSDRAGYAPHERLSKNEFGERMSAKFTRTHDRAGKVYAGIGKHHA